MSFEIKNLKGYFGSKGSSGTYQQIINKIPPHNTLVIPFTGHCAITRNIRPTQNWYLNDIDKTVIAEWKKYHRANKSNFATSTTFISTDWREMLVPQMDRKDVVYYFDPPYPHSTRKSNHRYKFEMSDRDHMELLSRVNDFNNANILLSTYDNVMYQTELSHWNKISFESRIRVGSATETLYFNFAAPEKLHDWRYFGDDYRERHEFKMKRKHMVNKFRRMSPAEKNYMLEAILPDHNINF